MQYFRTSLSGGWTCTVCCWFAPIHMSSKMQVYLLDARDARDARASLGKVWYAVPRAPSTWGDINSDFDSRWAVPAVPMYGPWPIIASHAQPCIGDLQIAAEVWTWMCMRRCLNWEGKCEKACKRSLRETREARTYEPSQDMCNSFIGCLMHFMQFFVLTFPWRDGERQRKNGGTFTSLHFTLRFCYAKHLSCRTTNALGTQTENSMICGYASQSQRQPVSASCEIFWMVPLAVRLCRRNLMRWRAFWRTDKRWQLLTSA